MPWKTILPPGWAWFHITSRSQYKADAHVDLPVIDGKVNAITRRGICPYHHQYTMPNAIYFHLNRSSTLKNKYQESGSFRIFSEMCHMWYFTFLSRSPLNLKRIQAHRVVWGLKITEIISLSVCPSAICVAKSNWVNVYIGFPTKLDLVCCGDLQCQ